MDYAFLKLDGFHSVLYAVIVDRRLDGVFASTEQWIFTGEIQFFHDVHIVDLQGLIHAFSLEPPAAREERKDGGSASKVLNLASVIVPVDSSTWICRRITSPHSGAPYQAGAPFCTFIQCPYILGGSGSGRLLFLSMP